MAGNAWNPNAPSTIGLEWLTSAAGTEVVATDAAAVGQRLVSKSAETITNLKAYVDAHTAPSSGTRRYVMDVYAAGSEVPGAADCLRYQPNGVANASGFISNGVAPTLYGNIDEVTGTCSDAIVLTNGVNYGNPGATADYEFNLGAYTLNR